ncbi:MAG: hypothetical protein ACC682_10250, partial [Gemmatimonadota bacterium]
MIKPVAGVVALAVWSACGGSDGSSPRTEPTVSDSAGITIVVNHLPQWTEEDRWTVSALPVVSIGELDGADEYQ